MRPVYLHGMDLRSPRVTDALLATVLAVATIAQIALDDRFDASVPTFAGALAVTAPIAWRRQNPFAVTLV